MTWKIDDAQFFDKEEKKNDDVNQANLSVQLNSTLLPLILVSPIRLPVNVSASKGLH